MRDSLYLYAPGERMGILPPPGHPVDLAALDVVPADAGSVWLFRLDALRLYDVILAGVGESDPDALQMTQGNIQEAEQALGFRIREDLLASLGTQWLIYQAPDETVLMVEVKDRERFSSCLDRLVERTEGAAQANDLEYPGGTIRHLCVTANPMPLAPSVVFQGNYAVFGLYPQTLKGFLARQVRDGPTIRDNQDFQRVTARFAAGCDSIGYQDIGSGLTDCYGLLTMLSPMLHAVPNASLRPELLPHPSVIRPLLFGMGTGCINTEDGILYEAFSPAGASGGLLALVGSVRRAYGLAGLNAGSLAVGAAMLMPALASARVQAKGAVCMSNARQIGLALAMYQMDHDAYPASLEDLSPDYLDLDYDQQILICPEDEDPPALPGGRLCSFRYVGRLAADVDAQVILLYEHAPLHDGQRTVLFADGHVERLSDDWLLDRLQESLEMVQQAGWDAYADERKKEIEAFYALGEPAVAE